MSNDPIAPPIPRESVIDRYFLEHRAKVIDIAAFLDRVDRAGPAPDGGDDFRLRSLRAAIGLLIDGEEVTPIRGEGEDADRISPWAVDAVERLLAPDFPLAMALETDGIMAFGLKGSTERHLVVAGRLGRLLVGVVSGADPAETLVRWQRARR